MSRNDEHKGTSNRGFASMDQAKQRAIASKGGQSVPPEKRSFSQDPALAAQAGRKGGENVPAEGRSFSQNRELAAAAGRKGGQARSAANPLAVARRSAAKLSALDPGTARHSLPIDQDDDQASNTARKSALPSAPLAREPEEARRLTAPPATAGTIESFERDEPEDRDAYAAQGDDIEGAGLGKSSRPAVRSGGNQHPHDAS